MSAKFDKISKMIAAPKPPRPDQSIKALSAPIQPPTAQGMPEDDDESGKYTEHDKEEHQLHMLKKMMGKQ